MICPSIWRALTYLAIVVGGIAGAVLVGPLWLRTVFAAIGLYGLACFCVTRSWLSVLAMFAPVKTQNRSQQNPRRSSLKKAIRTGAGVGALVGVILGGLTAFAIYMSMAANVPNANAKPNDNVGLILLIVFAASVLIGMVCCALGFFASALFNLSKMPELPNSNQFGMQTNENQPKQILEGQLSPQDRPLHLPLLPILGFLTMIYAWMLEVLVALGHHFSAGHWPGMVKFLVVTGVTVVSTYYRLTLRKKHAAFYPFLKRADLTAGQAALIICFLMFWVALGVWLVMGPPGEPFKPA